MQSMWLRLSDEQMQELEFVAKTQKRTKTEVICEAIENYLTMHKRQGNQSHESDIFGLWKDKNIDAVAYQQEVRAQWQ